MFTDMENWAEIRRRVLVDGQSKRSACREFEIHWDTLQKILDHPEPPGYYRTAPRPKPKLDPFLPVIHQILDGDKKALRKQRHTAQRIFQRLRDEYGYQGGLTVVKATVAVNWLGAPMFWSGFDAKSNRTMVEAAGFLIERATEETADEFGEPVTFLWMVARKPDPDLMPIIAGARLDAN